MIDPVRAAAVTPVAGVAVGPAEPRRITSAPVKTETSASLPKLLSLVAQLSESGPPVDYARIAQIRRAIADGSYQVDTEALAKAIVTFAAAE